MTSHVFTRFFRYDPRRASWRKMPAEHRDTPLEALAWLPGEEVLYALPGERGARALRVLHRYNGEGARLPDLPLRPSIPMAPGAEGPSQLHARSGMRVLVPPPAPETDAPPPPRALAIDPVSGTVHAAARGPAAEALPSGVAEDPEAGSRPRSGVAASR